MARFEETRTYANRSSAECFAAVQKALPKAGFEVWKTRPIAWLVLSRRKEGTDTLTANISCLVPGRMTVAMSADTASEDVLKNHARQIFLECEAQLLAPKG
jgi:hypothetical protein